MNKVKSCIFVTKYYRKTMRHVLTYLHEYYNQDALVMWGKTFVAMIVLNIPQYMPEVQGGVKLVTTIVGLGSALLGFTLMCFKMYDELKKRFKK